MAKLNSAITFDLNKVETFDLDQNVRLDKLYKFDVGTKMLIFIEK